ncbi:MAG: DUF87 domain-containing protein [Lachnospiraceae bacterium]|nr:DUF87 domain-containing protein [Lachnospiraceae bacterium]
MNRKNTGPIIRANNALLNVVAPVGMNFTKNTLSVGENIAKIYGVTRFPSKVSIGWLSSLTGLNDTIVTIGFEPCDNNDLLNTISKNIKAEAGIRDSSNSPREIIRAEKSVEDNTGLIEKVDHENETVGFVTINIMALSDDEGKFMKTCKIVESRVIAKKCKIRSLPNLQKESFEAVSPSFAQNEKINSIIHRIMPLSTLMGGIPFAAAGFSDPNGYHFANDHLGGLIMLAPWHRGGDRGNSNFAIVGKSGTGKSTAIKAMLIMNEFMMGTKIIVIDPESEFRDLCRFHKGSWINAAGGSKGMINPLQIRPSPKDEDDENEKLYLDEGMGLNDLALHIKNLEIFFSLYLPSLTDMHMAILKRELILLYADFGITWDTDASSFSATDFPVIKDLYDRISGNAGNSSPDFPHYQDLKSLLYDIAQGADSFLWNGHTTVESGENFICFDTNALVGMGNNVKRAQYFLLLQYCWEKSSANREERVMLIADEAHLMVDPQVPESLIYLHNYSKRIRKYEGALVVIFQSLVDVLDPSIKRYGQALLDNPCYKIIMGTDGQNLKETTELFNLTDAEQELLAKKKRGDALFIAGSSRMKIHFKIPQYKLDCLGTAAGR